MVLMGPEHHPYMVREIQDTQNVTGFIGDF